MDVHYQSDFASIAYEPEDKVVIATQYRIVEGAPLREYMNTIIDVLEETSANKLIADASACEGRLSQADHAWISTQWSHRAVEAGLEHVGIVMPESLVTTLVVDDIVKSGADPVSQKAFSTRSDAKDWLTSQTATPA